MVGTIKNIRHKDVWRENLDQFSGLHRLRVFISSKQDELKDERAYVKKSLRDMGIDSFVFEIDAVACPSTPRETFLSEVRRSDIYLGLFYKEYGDSVVDEYGFARDLGIPCLLYVKNVGRGTRSRKLESFLASIKDTHTYREFDTIIELDGVYLEILSVLTQSLRLLRRGGAANGKTSIFPQTMQRTPSDRSLRRRTPPRSMPQLAIPDF